VQVPSSLGPMTVCAYCARLACLESLPQDAIDTLPGFVTVRVYHHPTLKSLLLATETCNLCQALVDWLPNGAVQAAMEESQRGGYVYAVLKTYKRFSGFEWKTVVSQWAFELRSKSTV
jgi:hypothetical protein